MYKIFLMVAVSWIMVCNMQNPDHRFLWPILPVNRGVVPIASYISDRRPGYSFPRDLHRGQTIVPVFHRYRRGSVVLIQLDLRNYMLMRQNRSNPTINILLNKKYIWP